MPFRSAMRALLDGAARREELEALHATEARAREMWQEAKARSLIWPKPRLESRATPITPPTRKDDA